MRVLSFFSWGRLVAVALVAAAGAVAAAEQVTIERDSALHAEPRTDAAQVALLKQGTTAEVLGKNGVWLNVKAGEATGWTFSFNVRFPSQAQGPSGGSSVLGRLFAPRRASVATTSTIGIRGLDEADLKQAQYSAAQMTLLDSYAASRATAQALADERGLSAARVDYIDGGAR